VRINPGVVALAILFARTFERIIHASRLFITTGTEVFLNSISCIITPEDIAMIVPKITQF
jgi:hypothetical protein